jgi:hypothetical protein
MTSYTYKLKGIVCPYLMQGIFGAFLVFIWTIVINTGAHPVGILITSVITCFIVCFVYTGYPAKFNISSEGINLVFSFGNETSFEWKDVTDFQVTGPVGVIVVNGSGWVGRVFNKYFVFLWLLNDSENFRKSLSERIST